jgi:hypothetical protein
MKRKRLTFIGLAVIFFHALVVQAVNARQVRPVVEDNPPPPFDFRKERAADLAFSAGREAEEIKSTPDRVSIQLEAAQVLADVRPEQALQLLDSAWDALAKVLGSEKTPDVERHYALQLRVNVLTLFTNLAPDRAKKLAESLPALPDPTEGVTRKNNHLTMSPERQRADYLAQAGLEQLKADPAAGANTAVSSLNTRKVSAHLSWLPKAIFNRAGRKAVDDFENRVASMLSNKSSLDGDDYMAVADLLGSDPHMLPPARRGLLNFLSSSLQLLAQSIRRDADRPPSEAEMGTLKSGYFTFAIRVRPYVVSDAPERLELFDSHLSKVAAVVPQSWLDFNYELWTTDPAETQLSRALKTPDRALRDERLLNFTVRVLNGKVPGSKEDRLGLASKAVAEINRAETKEILNDYLRMAEVMKLAEEKAWAAAADKALTVARHEWRAWVLLGLADVQPKESPNGALALHEEAWRALEKSPTSARAAELMFLLARFVGRYDPPLALGGVAAAVKCANRASRTTAKPPEDFSLLRAFYVHLGTQHFAPGQELDGVDEIELGEEIRTLALYDWAGMESISKDVEAPALRLRYQIVMSRGVLAGAKVK